MQVWIVEQFQSQYRDPWLPIRVFTTKFQADDEVETLEKKCPENSYRVRIYVPLGEGGQG